MGHFSADNMPTAEAWHVYSSFSSAVDLTDGSHGPTGVFPRALQILTTGTIVVTRPGGDTETIVVPFPGFQIVGACETIKSSGDGTTVTSVIAYW